jgi:hypothetical protein
MNSAITSNPIFATIFDKEYDPSISALMKHKSIISEVINDYKNIEYEFMLKNYLKFIPNHSIIDTKCNDNGFMNDQSSYEPQKKWMSNIECSKFKYPCVYTINSNNEILKKWSSINDNGHFGITNFIFSNGNGYCKDLEGEYALTQWDHAINNYNVIKEFI